MNHTPLNYFENKRGILEIGSIQHFFNVIVFYIYIQIHFNTY